MIHSVFGSGFFSHLFLSIVVIAFYYFYLGFCELLKSYFYLFTIFQLLLWLTEMLFLIFWSFYGSYCIFSLINIDLSYILLFNLVFLFYFFSTYLFVSFVFFALFLSTLLWSCFFVFVFLVNSVLNWLTLCLVSFACWVSLLYFGFFDLFWFHLCVGVCMYLFLCYCFYLSFFFNFSRIFCLFLICLF